MSEKKPDYGFGIGIGLIVCGLILLAFPKFTELTGWSAGGFYAIGLIVLLIGVLGTSVEMFKR